ncbi:hypothetical protein SteCoe_18168 [Stentor coeruleus]|uniref:Selenoprotein T n=1 Tax=Stentor coeruleus TaxID=5963 RepID=A0A1R2BXP2_9CILI|nr:hypothetical protein SteCoe_18168 [Stentor coeruleus]
MELKSVVWICFITTLFLETIPFNVKTSESQPPEETPSSIPVDYDLTQKVSHTYLKKPLIIEYCQVCSYKGRVDQLKKALSSVYPSLIVVEEDYPTPQPWPLLAQLLSYLRIAGIILLVAGDHIFSYLQTNYPPWYLYMKNNKFSVGIMLFFGINLISNWMVSSGAFEVIYDGQVLYSGLKTQQLPSVDDIIVLLGKIDN